MTEQHFSDLGPIVSTNGYHAFPVATGSKKTSWAGWQRWCETRPNFDQVRRWCANYPNYGLAIACGSIVAIDIDETDKSKAADLEHLAIKMFGSTPLRRVGRWPKRALFYRAEDAISKTKVGPIDILGSGSYIVAFGIHPNTRKPYTWGEHSPATVRLKELPPIMQEQVAAFAAVFAPSRKTMVAVASHTAASATTPALVIISRIVPVRAGPWVVNAQKVVDGRDAWLACCVWDEACKGEKTAEKIARGAWARFAQTSDLIRPARNTDKLWAPTHALQKTKALLARDKIRTYHAHDNGSGENGFWTTPTKHAFTSIVTEYAAYNILTPAAMRISNLMLGLVHGQGTCFASVERIAEQLDYSLDHVKQSRRLLRQHGFWRSWEDKGGKGFIAHYQPCPEVLTLPSPEEALQARLHDQTVVSTPAMINQGGEGEDLWDELLLTPEMKKQAEITVLSIEGVGDIPRSGLPRTAKDVGNVPPEPTGASSNARGELS